MPEAAAAQAPADPTLSLQNLLQAQLSTPEDILALGFKPLASLALRNWRRLARRLSARGTNITIAAFGSQITMGHQGDSPKGSWVEELQSWLERAFPGTTTTVINLARSATDVVPAATCWYQYVPATVDLVLIEESAIGCYGNLQCHTFAAPRVAAYEQLLRRLIRRAPNAALLAVGTFNYQRFPLSAGAQGTSPSSSDVPNPLYGSGEDHHEVLARRYGIPSASTRDALYDLMQGGSTDMLRGVGRSRSELLVGSGVAPTSAGHRLYADIIAYTMQQTLAEELRQIAAGAVGAASITQERAVQIQQVQEMLQQLPPPVGPLAAEEADGDPTCAMDQAFKSVVNAAESVWWTWGTDGSFAGCPHDHCRVWGYRAKGRGRVLNMMLDTANVTAADSSLNLRSLVVFFTQGSQTPGWQRKMGTARVNCISGCECTGMQLGNKAARATQAGINLGYAMTQVSQHPNCSVSVTIDVPEGATEDEFNLNGVAVVPYGKMPRTNVDDLAFMFQARMT